MSRCFAHQVVVPHAKHFSSPHQPIYDQHGVQRFALLSLVFVSSVSDVLQSQSVFFQVVRISLLPVLLESFVSSPRSSLAVYLSFLASALAFGHLASFLQILRPSISLFRTLLVPPIISVRTLYQQVMPECVDSASSHSVHSSVVVLGRGLTQLLTPKPFETGFACMFLQPAPLFRMRCLLSLVWSSFLVARSSRFSSNRKLRLSFPPFLQNRRQACLMWVVSASPPSGRSVPFHPLVPVASLAGGIRRCEANDFAPHALYLPCFCVSKMLCSFVEGHVPPRGHVRFLKTEAQGRQRVHLFQSEEIPPPSPLPRV